MIHVYLGFGSNLGDRHKYLLDGCQLLSEFTGITITRKSSIVDLPMEELQTLVSELNSKMKNAAGNLEFEKAAAIRDQIIEIRQVLD